MTEPLPSWETDDLEQMRELIAQRPPNRELRHQIILGFLAGLLQGGGKLGYLELVHRENQSLFVPFITFSGDREAIEFIARLFGDVQEKVLNEDKGKLIITITGLRAIIILKLIAPYLHGAKKVLAERMVESGYKISRSERYEKLKRELKLSESIEQVSEKPVKICKRFLSSP